MQTVLFLPHSGLPLLHEPLFSPQEGEEKTQNEEWKLRAVLSETTCVIWGLLQTMGFLGSLVLLTAIPYP